MKSDKFAIGDRSLKSKMPPQRAGAPDDFQTPPMALDPIVPYMHKDWLIWECAEGSGNLVDALRHKGFDVLGSDKWRGNNQFDFLVWQPREFDCIVTNPPFSLKDEFLARCYLLEKSFALLLPITALGG